MPDNRLALGNVEVISLSDGQPEFPASNVFPNLTDSDWRRHPDARTPQGTLPTNLGCFLLRAQGQTVLIDTGIGPAFPGRLLDQLGDSGVSPNDITIVAFTHLHPDHVGWNVSQEGGQQRLTFPRAQYWVPQKDWDHFRQPDVLEGADHIKNQVLPLEQLGALRLIESETPVTSEVTTIPTPGHTPGHVSYIISSQGQRGVILGDVVNFPFQIQETAWEIAFDSDKETARRTREAMLERLEQEGSVVGAGHFAPPSFGKIVRGEGRRYWQPLA